MRILGLALVAMFAFAAFSAVSASANPQWWECKKNKGVGLLEKGCTKEGGKGGYELVPGVGKGKAFKGKGGLAILHNVIPGKGDIKVECASFKDGGKVANVGGKGTEFGVTSTFSKCKSLGAPCSSGAKKETISTETLAGNLGWLNKAGKKSRCFAVQRSNSGLGLPGPVRMHRPRQSSRPRWRDRRTDRRR